MKKISDCYYKLNNGDILEPYDISLWNEIESVSIGTKNSYFIEFNYGEDFFKDLYFWENDIGVVDGGIDVYRRKK